MTSQVKAAATPSSDQPNANLYRLAIVGAATLKGKEVSEVLGERNFPSMDIRLLDDDESLGQLEAVQDEVTFIQKVRAEQFGQVDFTFFACDPECTRKNWKAALKAGSAIVDLSFALEEEPNARIRSPWVERQRGQGIIPELQPGPAVAAHPAAVVMALLLLRAQKAGAIRRTVATVFEPASEHGQKGMDELHEQTVNLLSFQQLPKAVFDVQVAFNLVSRYGQQATPSLSTIEQRVQKHYAQIAGKDAPFPSIQLVQAPIFHGHAFSIHLEFEQAADVASIMAALTGEHVAVTHAPDEAPNNVNAAGQSDILVSVVPDPASVNGCWVWAASDNLRIAANTAVECAETMAATRPRGQIQ